jgi:PAS domain S-box-containing protein
MSSSDEQGAPASRAPAGGDALDAAGGDARSASERRYADLVERIPLGVFVARAGVDGAIVLDYASSQLGRILARDPAEVVRDPAGTLALVDADDLARLRAGVREVRARGGRSDWEGRVVVAGEDRVLRVQSEADGPEVVRGFVEDVTERRQAERALRASEERYRLLADNAYDVVWTMSLDGRVTYISPAVERVRGFAPQEAMRQAIPEIHPPASAAIVTGYFTRLYAMLAEGRVPERFVGELEYWCKDGSTIWAELQVVPRLGPGGEVVEILGVSRDVTARRRAEEARRASEADLAEAQRIAHVGSWSVDVRTDAVSCSREMSRICEAASDEHVDGLAGFFRWVAPESRAALEGAVARTREVGEPHEVALELRLPSGRIKHVVARGEAVRDDAGAIVRVRGTLADVTALRRLEARLAEAQRLEAVGRLAGGVAHEFNNVLMAMLGTTELLASATAPGDPARDDLESILDGGRRAAALTRQLLAFGQRQAMQPRALDVGRALGELAPLVRRTLGDGVELGIEVAAGLGPALVDPAQLEHVLVSLARNARAALRDHGTLTISVDEVPATSAAHGLPPGVAPGRFVRVSLTDTGAGIEPAALPHLFEPFYTSQAFGVGGGLGLATVHGIVAQSRGFIVVESELGRGSTFRVHLPSAPAAAAPRGARASAGPARRGAGTLLLVEDEPQVRRVTAKILRNLGYTVREAADGQEAMAIDDAELATIDLVVTDVVMPGIDGPHLAALLAQRRPGLRAIFATGFAPEVVQRDRIVEPGAIVVHKPFTLDELSSAVRRALGEGAG